ncbi:MAG: hypothetical protein E5W27_04450, partial [Mesorhizobium sp.]
MRLRRIRRTEAGRPQGAGRGARIGVSDYLAPRSSSFAPPSVLPDISPTRGEIGSFDAALSLQ